MIFMLGSSQSFILYLTITTYCLYLSRIRRIMTTLFLFPITPNMNILEILNIRIQIQKYQILTYRFDSPSKLAIFSYFLAHFHIAFSVIV